MNEQLWQKELDKAREHLARAVDLAQAQVESDGYRLVNLSVYVNTYEMQTLGERNPKHHVGSVNLEMSVS